MLGCIWGSIRSVPLDIPMELLKDVAPEIVLRQLEFLLLLLSFYTLLAADNSELLFSDAVRTNILPFFNNHTCSLQTLEMSLRTAGSWMHPLVFRGDQFDLGPLFKGLYYAPHLNTLSLIPFPPFSKLMEAHCIPFLSAPWTSTVTIFCKKYLFPSLISSISISPSISIF